MSEEKSKQVEEGHGHSVAPIPQPAPSKSWVTFDDETERKSNGEKVEIITSKQAKKDKNDSPAVISTESVQINLERSLSKSTSSDGTGNNVAVLDPKPLRNVELPVATVEPIRQGFCKFCFFFNLVLSIKMKPSRQW